MLSIRGRRQENEVKTIKTLIRENISTIEDYVQRQGVVTGIPTGFTDLDKMTSGLQASEMIVIAGRPSMGKTSLAMNIAEFVSLEAKLPVGVFSLEMSAPSLTLRMLCSRARVNLRSIREGFLAERDVPRLRTAADRLMNAPIYIDDSGALTIMQLRAKARRMAMQYDIKLAVIDYLQLLKSTNRKVKSRQEEISDISSGIKALAKELGIPIIVMSQLNREMEREKNRKPRLADLRESGAIEQDADFVGMLYRPKSDDEDSEEDYNDAVAMNLLIAKQRNGPTGDVNLTFLKSFTRFESAARVSDEDVPQQTQFPT
jgi:replicative DNA helicase